MREALRLRDYQEGMRAFAHETPRCGLWADMGLGKTATTLAIMKDAMRDRFDTGRWLVVAPKLVAADAWPRQLKRWDAFADLAYRNFTAEDFDLVAARDPETGRRTGLCFASRDSKATVKRRLQGFKEPIHLVSWDNLQWMVQAYGANWPYDGLVLDEATFAANSTTARHKAAYHVIHNLQRVGRVIELTGMPTPNGYEQLHGQIRLLDPDRLGRTKTEFQQNWMTPIQMGHFTKWKMRKGSKEAIDGLLGDLCVSLRGEHYLSLPERVVNRLEVSLPDSARELYDRLENDLVADLDDGVEILAPTQAALMGKLLQVANGAVYDKAKGWHAVHDAKLEALDELLECAPGPVLLAYNFDHDWQRIKQRVRSAVHVHDRGALDNFRKGKVKLLCMHPASGGHGLDGLQEVSSTAVWFGATYNAEHWGQFNARLHRDGQRAGRVVVHQILAADTVEQHVNDDSLRVKITEAELLLHAVRMRRKLPAVV